MTDRQVRTMMWACGAIIAAWILAWAGYRLAQNSRMTAEKLRAYLSATELSRLGEKERAAALQALADKLNALSIEERRRVRAERQWAKWLAEMTDKEKQAFIEATLPTGITKMMSAFERLSEEQRRRTLEEALQRLRSTGEVSVGEDRKLAGSREPQPPISPQLEQKIRELGLKTFFAESSAQLKVEAAPLLEEIQRQMQSGGFGRRGSQ